MLRKDSHVPGSITQNTQTTTIRDFTGGLNLSDPPLLLKENQLLEATNWQYSQDGNGIETRDPVFFNATAGYDGEDYTPSSLLFRSTFLQPIDGLMFCVVDGGLYSFPSLLKSYDLAGFRCSDFNWMRLGVWNCEILGDYFAHTCDEYEGTIDWTSLVTLYDPTLYRIHYVGELTGDLEPIGAMWGDSNPELLIASGGKLQLCKYGGTLETMTDSPDCTYVTKRDGRVVVNDLEFSSRLVFSGVGDPKNWKQEGEDGWTEADSIWIDVGYKSGGGISSVATLSKDLIVWKTNGTAHRLTGSYPDWAVYEIGSNVWNANPYCPLEVGGDLFFPDTFFGFSSIQTVIQYGEMRAGQVGYEVNKTISSEMDVDARMWSVPSRGEIWMKTKLGADYVYVYNLKHRAWTKFVFPLEVMGAVSVGTVTYVSLAGSGTDGVRTAAYLMGSDVEEFFDEAQFSETEYPYSDILLSGTGEFTGGVRYDVICR